MHVYVYIHTRMSMHRYMRVLWCTVNKGTYTQHKSNPSVLNTSS